MVYVPEGREGIFWMPCSNVPTAINALSCGRFTWTMASGAEPLSFFRRAINCRRVSVYARNSASVSVVTSVKSEPSGSVNLLPHVLFPAAEATTDRKKNATGAQRLQVSAWGLRLHHFHQFRGACLLAAQKDLCAFVCVCGEGRQHTQAQQQSQAQRMDGGKHLGNFPVRMDMVTTH